MDNFQWNGLPIVIFGTSGNSKEVLYIVEGINKKCSTSVYDIKGFVSENKNQVGNNIHNHKVICCDDTLEEYICNLPVVGVIIPVTKYTIKRKIVDRLKEYNNIVFPNIIASTTIITDEKNFKIGVGNIIAEGSILTCDVEIGDFNFINNGCTIGHEVKIENYCAINPLVSISGNVTIKSDVLIGASSSIKQGIVVEEKATVGLGAFVVKDVEASSTMICKAANKLERG